MAFKELFPIVVSLVGSLDFSFHLSLMFKNVQSKGRMPLIPDFWKSVLLNIGEPYKQTSDLPESFKSVVLRFDRH